MVYEFASVISKVLLEVFDALLMHILM